MKIAIYTGLFWAAVGAFGVGVSFLLGPLMPTLDAFAEARLALAGVVIGAFVVADVIGRLNGRIAQLEAKIREMEDQARR